MALALGGFVTYVDSRPTWDDTGITAGALFVISAVFGYLGPSRPWVWALAQGIWIPLLSLVRGPNGWAILSLVVTFVGAYGGRAIRAWLE